MPIIFAYTQGQKSLHVFEPLFGQLVLVLNSHKLHPRNCIDQSNNISKAQVKRIIIWQVRAGQSFGFKKTPFLEGVHFSAF